MTARLQPAAQLAVEEQQHAPHRRVEHEAAAGQVPRLLRAQVRVARVIGDEAADESGVARLFLVGVGVCSQLCVEMRPIDAIQVFPPPPQAARATLPRPVDSAESALHFAPEKICRAVGNLCPIGKIFSVLTTS